MDNDVSQPILLDGDDDIDGNGKENRFISEEEENQNLKNVKASPTKPAAVVDVKVEVTPFEPQEPTLDEFEDSFDRWAERGEQPQLQLWLSLWFFLWCKIVELYEIALSQYYHTVL